MGVLDEICVIYLNFLLTYFMYMPHGVTVKRLGLKDMVEHEGVKIPVM